VYFKDYDKPNGATRNSTTSLSLTPNDSSPEKIFENENEKNLQLTERKDRTNSLLILESIARDRSRSGSLTIRHGHSHGDQRTEIATVAWMIIFGDGLHNFIDGITIGAAFSQSILEGISISVAVICEEFPHELGDFAVLIASGMTMRQALGYNFLSACTCYLGMGFGIALGDLADASPYVFALAGGMFLYIALVDMMGELSAALDKASLQGMSQTLKVLVLQNIGILVGICTLLFLAKYGDKINFEGLAPPKQSDIPFTES
jgi:zinc transporter ZupT